MNATDSTHKKPTLNIDNRKSFLLILSFNFSSCGIGIAKIARSIAIFVPAAA